MYRTALALGLPFLLAACSASSHPLDDFEPVPATTVVESPAPDKNKNYDAEVVEQGRYMVELLGCGACHTDGALIGEPRTDRLLAGSRVGLAHSNPLQEKRPGVVFPSNLTPDVETGIGGISDAKLARAIRHGVGVHGVQSLKVMPVVALSRLKDDDVNAIVAYLRNLPAVVHRVPDDVPEGKKTNALYVHFGSYRSRASGP